MTNQFLTIEDVNGAIYRNQGFYWHEIDTANISTTEDYTDVKYDFCRITRETLDTDRYKYTIYFDASNFTKRFYMGDSVTVNSGQNRIVIFASIPSIKVSLYMGNIIREWCYEHLRKLLTFEFFLTYPELNTPQRIYYKNRNGDVLHKDVSVQAGYNFVEDSSNEALGYVLVNIVKSDFQFQCNQTLKLGKINRVSLGTDTDYKPNGSMVGEYTPTIRVLYKGKTIPVTYDETLTDYVFNLDLTDITDPSKIRFTVEIDANDVINSTSTEVKLQADYETINNLTGLTNLINNGGVGRLGANITLTNPLTIKRDVYIIGNDKTINLNSKQIIIGTGRTFKAEKTSFTNGVNSIHQNTGSTVELTNCTFNNCTGTGSIIECDIELHSLDNPTDFTTKLTGCTFTNNDLCILHGGELTVENCTITGKISNPNYPYFLYQTDGSAILLRNTFNLSSNTTINTDIEFNSCIFICGETGQINGLSHTELKDNNIESFLETPQNNTSSINVTYHYSVIDDNITLQSNNGYCHTVSGEDTIYKTNITATRS